MLPISVNLEEASTAVAVFNSRYADMEWALWQLSRAAREDLERGIPSEILAEMVWTVRSWWGVQGTEREVKRIAPVALVDLKLEPEAFEEGLFCLKGGESLAVELVSRLVERLKAGGARRNEWSLCSKALHWLLPWRIPIFDSFVCKSLGIPSGTKPHEAYSRVAKWEFGIASRLMGEGTEWLGGVEPKTPFRALDKYLWWLGGGSSNTAVVVKDARAPLRRVGLDG